MGITFLIVVQTLHPSFTCFSLYIGNLLYKKAGLDQENWDICYFLLLSNTHWIYLFCSITLLLEVGESTDWKYYLGNSFTPFLFLTTMILKQNLAVWWYLGPFQLLTELSAGEKNGSRKNAFRGLSSAQTMLYYLYFLMHPWVLTFYISISKPGLKHCWIIFQL